MFDRIAEFATVIAVLIEAGIVLAFFAGLGVIILTSFGVIPGPY